MIIMPEGHDGFIGYAPLSEHVIDLTGYGQVLLGSVLGDNDCDEIDRKVFLGDYMSEYGVDVSTSIDTFHHLDVYTQRRVAFYVGLGVDDVVANMIENGIHVEDMDMREITTDMFLTVMGETFPTQ